MSKNDQRKKFNRQMSDSRKAIEAFAKLDEEKYIKKNKKWCGGKKEAREYFCYELEDSLPGTIMFIMMQGYVNKPEIKELKNNVLIRSPIRDSVVTIPFSMIKSTYTLDEDIPIEDDVYLEEYLSELFSGSSSKEVRV